MIILGIDFGLSKVGIAIATSQIAEPLEVIKYQEIDNLTKQIKKICEEENIQKIILGISENQMAIETKKFADRLKQEVNIPIEFFDETLTTYDAQRLSQESGMRRSKRKNLEDAMAAAVMLQNYIDSFKLI